MAVPGKPVHLEADYRNLARTLSSISLPKDGGSKQGCYPGAMRRQLPRSKTPNLAAPRGIRTYEGLLHQLEAGLEHAISGLWGEPVCQHEP